MLQDAFPVFLTLFILIDPLGVSMVYLSLVAGAGLDRADRRFVAMKAPVVAFGVLALFIFFGRGLINSLGILPGSLYVAGGILLFSVAMDLLLGKPKRTKGEGNEGGGYGTDIAVFPLALPLLSGPGAITAILIFTSERASDLAFSLTLTVMVAIILALGALAMLGSEYIRRVLRRTGVSVIERIMGILLAGMSVQFVYDGLHLLEVL
jgi:multiple antibiotic resistance protein